jgi:hypothetical protein
VADAEEHEERNRRVVDSLAELLRHVNTLSTAAAVLSLVLFRELGVPKGVTVFALSEFGISLSAGIWGLMRLYRKTFVSRTTVYPGSWDIALLTLATVGFVVGLISLMVGAFF